LGDLASGGPTLVAANVEEAVIAIRKWTKEEM